MKEFFEEFKYMCSASNTKSRGFYIFIAIGLAVLALGFIISAVLLVINIVKGFFIPLFAILTVVTLVILVLIILWLKFSK